jgi:hypothetical protein
LNQREHGVVKIIRVLANPEIVRKNIRIRKAK